MRSDTMTPESAPSKRGTISEGLLMVPKAQNILNAMSKHKRAGSTGTTGDESCTTDEDFDLDADEVDSSKTYSEFGSYSDIATITDKIKIMHRNSSDSSVYSEFEKYEKTSSNEDFKALGCNSDSSEGDRVDFAGSIVEGKAVLRLQNELKEANQEIKCKDEELVRLGRIRKDVESELEDLTASLFQEAHNMVREANEKAAAAEKSLKESQMKVDVLTAEVSALKTLVLTSTPSHPNPHLHPQISKDNESGVAIFTKKHRRSPSHFNLKYGRENSPPCSPVKEIVHISSEIEYKEGLEVDPVLHKEFLQWKEKPTLEKTERFLQRIYSEDINLCLTFTNKELSEKVAKAVESGTIHIEAVGDRTKAMFPKKCSLLEVPRLCFYRMSMGESDDWFSISQICRNRIIAVCDFLNYLKYIERGLVKSSAHDVYWEIVRLRKNISMARLGLNIGP
ncbi:unnamed protein product [Brassicogethes aeneus]|uniref:GDP/GTP exchange factor Sec2 N-terminal domain-containing protein n=1 Tax=Brassicogethes aeneus TaxID=1431903 RepID=A0A9P0BFA7_BRAAE|nr:unnamed protein product [Brassicogethes aeneus]